MKRAAAPVGSRKNHKRKTEQPDAAEEAPDSEVQNATPGDEERYRQISMREQVLLRPGMYVGSTTVDTCQVWLYDSEQRRMVRREVAYVPAFLKLFDEILMNAIDHATTQKARRAAAAEAAATDVQLVRHIRVRIDRVDGCVEITNDGDGLPVTTNEAGIHIPELVFGHLLTSSNYDDVGCIGRIVGGQNGIGAKACNIFSTRFEIETVDRHRKRVYTQRFGDNMTRCDAPTLKYSAAKPYTTVRFWPDFARLNMTAGLGDDAAYQLLVKRTYDAAAVTDPDVAVHLDGQRLEVHTFERFVDLHLPAGAERVYERVNDWWEVAAAASDGDGLQQVSFVNGVCTLRGGKHVDHVVAQIVRKLTELIQSKRASSAAAASGIRAQFIKDNLFVFVKATIPNPTFEGQCKDTLSTPAARFGGERVELSARFVEKLYAKSGIVDRVLTLNEASADRSLKKTDGKKQTSVTGIPKLDDANWAGGPRSAQCTLILTEGDSAKTMAIAGLTQAGRDRFGVFPLRGKVRNVCDLKADGIAACAEVCAIKKILGLESGKAYEDARGLRYGRVMVMTDQDVDGSHIKGLLFNLFHQLWPSLLRVDGFMCSMLTPIIKARRRGAPTLEFYNAADYDAWRASQPGGGRGWDIKYYKGLGTSTSAEAKEYFRALKVMTYAWRGEPSRAALDMAFNKKCADARKEWLKRYDKTAGLDYGQTVVPYETFVDRDLIHFSNYDVERSIPSAIDGLKTSQRKVVFGCLKRNLTRQQAKVAQLAGYVAENAAYHHGEVSLNATIVGMAQDFVGSNNVNLLLPLGQFGSRIQGGKDSAAARYIHTLLSPVAGLLLKAEDDACLTFLEDDGQRVEPEFYVPVLPLVLVNGALGIGTGFSTSVPSYHPLHVTAALRALIRLDDAGNAGNAGNAVEHLSREALAAAAAQVAELQLHPWYRGFAGSIERVGDGRYVSRGRFERTKPTEIAVTELPLGYWTDDFKAAVEALRAAGTIKAARHNHSDTKVSCVLVFPSAAALDDALVVEGGDTTNVEVDADADADADASNCDDAASAASGASAAKTNKRKTKATATRAPASTAVPQTRLEKMLKLVSNRGLSTRNMYLFNRERRIQKYDTVLDVLLEFYAVRLAAYATRKRVQLEELRARADVLANKIRFLQAVIDGSLIVHSRSRAELEAELETAAYMRAEPSGFDYLLRMPIFSLTLDKKLELDGQLEAVRASIATIEGTTEKEMWLGELAEFEAKYERASASAEGATRGDGPEAEDEPEEST